MLVCLCSAVLASGAEDVPESSPGILPKKEIVSVQWMNRDFTQKIDTVPSGSDVGLWVQTRNYPVGEVISVVVGEEVEGLSVGDRRFSGVVDAEGNVRMLVDTSARAEAMTEAQVREMLDALARKAPQKLHWATSVVDLLKLLGQDSSLAARQRVAAEGRYTGARDDSAARNVWMHRQVMSQLAANGGKLPFTPKD